MGMVRGCSDCCWQDSWRSALSRRRSRAPLSLRWTTTAAGLGARSVRSSTVTRVLDGDTLDTSAGRVRLYGVDAPEAGEGCTQSATESLRAMAGREVRLERGPRPRDVFGRRLAYVYRKDGRSIDAALVWAGYAVAWPEDGQHRAALAELERDARSAGRGCLW